MSSLSSSFSLLVAGHSEDESNLYWFKDKPEEVFRRACGDPY